MKRLNHVGQIHSSAMGNPQARNTTHNDRRQELSWGNYDYANSSIDCSSIYHLNPAVQSSGSVHARKGHEDMGQGAIREGYHRTGEGNTHRSGFSIQIQNGAGLATAPRRRINGGAKAAALGLILIPVLVVAVFLSASSKQASGSNKYAQGEGGKEAQLEKEIQEAQHILHDVRYYDRKLHDYKPSR